MLLKSLDIQGFKSFPDKTHLEFSRGFSAVVGPNGSGKSNISDAIRWALGEQSSKTLRGSKMEDVIFLGSKSRHPQGFAQVSLTFDNTDRELPLDDSEVVVTRKYYRSGESEYGINGKSVLLKDVSQLFMDTGFGKDGYSLIGQGRIDEIVSAKSADRREIFEEAAGISKFRYRKKEAQRRLQLAEENLVRLTDIIGELQTRIGPLKEQSEKAARFQELDQKKQTLEISIWVDDLRILRQKLRQQDDSKEAAQQQYQKWEEAIKQAESEIKEATDQLGTAQEKVEMLRQQKEETHQLIGKSESQIAVYQNDISHHQKEKERLLQEQETFQLSGSELQEKLEEKNQVVQQLQTEFTALEEEIHHTENDLQLMVEQEELKTEEEKEYQKRMSELTLIRSRGSIHIASLQEQQQELKKQIDEKKEYLKEEEEEFSKEQKQQESVIKEQEALLEKEQSYNNQKDGYQLKYEQKNKIFEKWERENREMENALTVCRQKIQMLEDMQRNMEGFSYSVKKVIEWSEKGRLSGIIGTVANHLHVPRELAVAIETALGNALQNIIVQDEEAAKKAIAFLKRENLGRCTFLPLTSMKERTLSVSGIDQMEGYVGVADRLISYDTKLKHIFSNLLGRTVVVKDMDCAISISKTCGYSCKLVTLDGQVIHPGGSITGGSKSRHVGLLSKEEEIKKYKQEEKTLSEQIASVQDKKLQAKQSADEMQAYVNDVKAEILQLSEEKIRLQGENKRLEEGRNQRSRTIERIQREQEDAQQKMLLLQKEEKQRQAELQAAQQEMDTLEKTRQTSEDGGKELNRKRAQLEERLHGQRITLAEKKKDWEAEKAFAKEMQERYEGASEKEQKLKEEQENKEKTIADILESIEKTRVQIQSMKQGKSQLDDEIEQKLGEKMQWEQRITEQTKKERELLREKEKSGFSLAKTQERFLSLQKDCEQLSSKLWEQYRLSPAQAEEMAEPIEEIQSAQKNLSFLKDQIRNLGQINLHAIEEYQEVNERYTFLQGQIEDVQSSKKELHKLIDDLTKKMTTLFQKTFDAVNKNFQRVFSELFGGGEAHLRLEDPSQILDCGIAIEVQPPGKIIKQLSSLSGGEKAFVAIALYFAILKVKPSPFCVLDEIEAALDDVNVYKFASYLKQLSDKTQFIVITHRRGTMEQADILYGVTMQEEGVSKLLRMPAGQKNADAATA